jgi:uncharacterized protein YecT (DUF1311 family)
MPATLRLIALAAASFLFVMSLLMPVSARATNDFIAASSSQPIALKACNGGEDDTLKPEACKPAGYDKLVAAIDKAFAATLAKTPANIRPLLRRDEVWFDEIILAAGEDGLPEDFSDTLRQRATTLAAIAAGFGRPGYSGHWVNALGRLDVAAADGGSYRLEIATSTAYGADDRRRECKVTAQVQTNSGGWLGGIIVPDEDAPAAAKAAPSNAQAEAAKPVLIKIRRQGETLRVVVSGQPWSDDDRPDCRSMFQITGSYFAAGKDEHATDKADITFVAPTFDCTRPETASNEEICADADLADNDQRLNKAWKALLPRLDEVTRHALMEDQRGWIHAQAWQYPEFLHPAWEKLTSSMHYTANGRAKLNQLQRERIALLEGFDDKRAGIVGVWIAHNAIINVTADKDGISAKGWKWQQGVWKDGCDYDMSGDLAGGAFRSGAAGNNPDTLERDHATLIVNRQDDAFAKKRKPGTDEDEWKCKRLPSNSSTARLFPARPSPDISDFNDIR